MTSLFYVFMRVVSQAFAEQFMGQKNICHEAVTQSFFNFIGLKRVKQHMYQQSFKIFSVSEILV